MSTTPSLSTWASSPSMSITSSSPTSPPPPPHSIPVPPIVHAVGGSIGSAFSLLLLYPLERARIEMQMQQVSNNHSNNYRSSDTSTNTSFCNESNHDQHHDNDNERNKSNISLDRGGYYQDTNNDGTLDSVTDNDDNDNLCNDNITSKSQRSEIIHEYDNENSNNSNTHNELALKRKCNKNKNNNMFTTIQSLHTRKELYKGVTPVAITMGISNFVFFYSLQVVKKILFHYSRSSSGSSHYHNTQNNDKMIKRFLNRLVGNMSTSKNNSNGNNASLLASMIAGVVNVLLTNPLWMANLRIIQSNDNYYEYSSNNNRNGRTVRETSNINNNRRKMTLLKMIYYIIKNEGITQLWNGTWTSLILVCNPAIQYYIYERCKFEILFFRKKRRQFMMRLSSSEMKHVVSNNSDDMGLVLNPLDAFLLGAFAKAIATFVTYPLQLAQVLMRMQRNQQKNIKQEMQQKVEERRGDSNYNDNTTDKRQDEEYRPHFKGTFDCIRQLYNQNGLKALFAGMEAKLVQTVLTSALTFLTYEQIVGILAKSYSSFCSS